MFIVSPVVWTMQNKLEMKRIKILIAFFTFTTVIFSLASCNYDDSGIRNRIDNIDERLTTLEEVVKEMNNDISSLMTVVQALKNQVSITSVKDFEDGTGYYIDFSDGKHITIINGKDGSDGDTPVISVKVDSDGEYYWTVNGEWLLDENEAKIPATSKTQVPQIRVENGNFELSFNGVDWQIIGSAGSAGIFKEVIPGKDSVTFILNEGDPIVIPLAQEFALNIEKVEFPVTAGGFVNVPYTISACDEGTAIMAFATGGFTAEVGYNFDNDISSGNVGITCPDPLTDGKVVVIATNSKGIASARILSFEQGVFEAMELGEKSFPAEGGTLEVYINTNYEYNVIIPSDAQAWITYAITKAVRTEFLHLTIAPNTTPAERSAEILLRDNDSITHHKFTITQAAGTGEKEPGYYNNIEDWERDGTIQF